MANETAQYDPIPDDEWDLIIDRIQDRQCVPFLGAGASVSAGVPIASVLARKLAKRIGFPGTDEERGDFLRVFQYCAMAKDDGYSRKFLVDELKPFQTPGVVHTTLASMPFPYVLTTNFDCFMESAFQQVNKTPRVLSYERRSNVIEHIGNVDDEHPLVYKLHGSIEKPVPMVVSEDDVVDFQACVLMRDPELPPVIKTLFSQHSVLFIGYGLKDWNIRVLLRALRGREPVMQCFAVQKRPGDVSMAKEWDTTVIHLRRGRMHCYDVDAVRFVQQMKARYEKRLRDQANDPERAVTSA